jgi:hypothetical protein
MHLSHLHLLFVFSAIPFTFAQPLQKNDNTFNIAQVPNPNYVRNGALSLAKSYIRHKCPVSKQLKGEVAAMPQEFDSEYFCPVNVGGQVLNVDFDTGAGDL